MCPCRKLIRRANYLLNTYSWSVLRIEGDSRSFPQRAVDVFVRLSGWFGERSSSPKVKHITQMCHSLGWAWMLLKASVRPQQECRASFDEEMAFLPFLSYCLRVPAMGTLQGGLYICGVKRRIMISLLSVKSQSRFGDSVDIKENVKTKKDETTKGGKGKWMEGAPSGHFVPWAAADWKTYPCPLTLRCI